MRAFTLLAVFALTTVAFLASMGAESGAELETPLPEIDRSRTAIVITDPPNDFLSPKGATGALVGKSVEQNRTVPNIEALFKAAKAAKIPVFISPHYYYPQDKGWRFGGKIEQVMKKINMFARTGPTSSEGFEGSGADWLERYKPYINDENTIVCSPHKVYGPESNDLALQLRKRRIETVFLAGMSANLCVEAHMRELIEQGFEVYVVCDATAAATLGEDDGYKAAMVNFGFISSGKLKTADAVGLLTNTD